MKSIGSTGAVALAFLVAAVLAGCGGEVASQQEQPVASPPEQQNYSGLTVYSLVEAGFSIGVPSGWTAMTAEDAYGADAIVEANPKLAEFRDLLLGADSPFKLVALEYDPEACICSTINILAFPFQNARQAREFEAGGLAGAREFALPGTKPKVTRVKLPAGAGVRISTRTTLHGTDIRVITTQYFIHTPTSAYILGYTASPDVTKTYGRLFDRSAQSLREV
jgi:hypothetical protein